MIVLEEVPQTILTKIPDVTDCRVLVVQEEDDLQRDFPQAGRFGLLSHLDDCWQEPFAWVRVVTIRGCRLFVAKLAKNYQKGCHVVVVPDADWLDEPLRLVLGVEAEETSSGG